MYVLCRNGRASRCCCCWCFGGRSCTRRFDVGFCGIGRNICRFSVLFALPARPWRGGYVTTCRGLSYKDSRVSSCLGYFECYSALFSAGICRRIAFAAAPPPPTTRLGSYGVSLLESAGNNITSFPRNICVVLSRNGGFFLFLFWSV